MFLWETLQGRGAGHKNLLTSWIQFYLPSTWPTLNHKERRNFEATDITQPSPHPVAYPHLSPSFVRTRHALLFLSKRRVPPRFADRASGPRSPRSRRRRRGRFGFWPDGPKKKGRQQLGGGRGVRQWGRHCSNSSSSSVSGAGLAACRKLQARCLRCVAGKWEQGSKKQYNW